MYSILSKHKRLNIKNALLLVITSQYTPTHILKISTRGAIVQSAIPLHTPMFFSDVAYYIIFYV